MGIYGKANYERRKSSQFANRIKYKDNPPVFRIIPPIKNCVDSGTWYTYTAQHFGYFLPNSRSADKPLYAPFACPQRKNRDGLVTVDCAECKSIAQKLDERKAVELKFKDATKEQLAEALMPFNLWLKAHNLSKKHNLNVKTDKGEYGHLQIGYRAFKTLCSKIDDLRKEGIDPIDPDQGVWFQLTQLPKDRQNDVNWKVDVIQDVEVSSDGRRLKAIKMAPLAESENESIMANCADLNDLTRNLSSEQVSALVQCSGDPQEVAAIMNVATTVVSEYEDSPEPDIEPPVAYSAPAAPEKTPPPPVAVEAPQAAPPSADKMLASMDAQMMEMFKQFMAQQTMQQAAVTTTPMKVVSVPPAKASTPQSSLVNVSDDEFLAALANK